VFASSHPDGLEWVAARLGFENAVSEKSLINSPMPDYSIFSIQSSFLSTFLSGIIGTVMVFLAAIAVAKFAGRKHR